MALVASTLVVAVLGGGVSFSYWYFAQRPIENEAQQQAVEREEIRRLYEDSRRLVVEVGERLHSGEGNSTDVASADAVLRRARRIHNQAYRLMQDGAYEEAGVEFRKAQEMLRQCLPCQGTLD